MENEFNSEQAQQAYIADKRSQYETMDTYVTQNGYSWQREQGGTQPNGSYISPRTEAYYLEPNVLQGIRDKAKWHLIVELREVGVELWHQ